MTGTKEGGIKASKTNKLIYGEDFYKIMGRKGGQVTGVLKGFALDPERARKAGRKGGKISRRGRSKNNENN